MAWLWKLKDCPQGHASSSMATQLQECRLLGTGIQTSEPREYILTNHHNQEVRTSLFMFQEMRQGDRTRVRAPLHWRKQCESFLCTWARGSGMMAQCFCTLATCENLEHGCFLCWDSRPPISRAFKLSLLGEAYAHTTNILCILEGEIQWYIVIHVCVEYVCMCVCEKDISYPAL